MERTAFWAATGAVFLTIATTEAASARGAGGNNDGDSYLRQQMHNPGYLEPSPYAYRHGYRRNDPGAEYEAYRRGYPIYGEWGWKYR